MSIEKLQRVIWRLKEKNPPEWDIYSYVELERSIMLECGTSQATYYANKRALVKLGWIKRRDKKHFVITEAGKEQV